MLEGAAGRNSSWPKEGGNQRGCRNEGLSGRLRARGAVWEVARERGCVREVAGESACSGGCRRGGVCGVVCVVSSSYFLCRDGVLGCAGVLHLILCAGRCAGVFRFFFPAPEITSEAFFWAPSSTFPTNAHTAKLQRWQVSHSALSFLLWFV